MSLTTERKIIIGFGIALLILLVVGFASYRSIVTLHETAAVVTHTHDVLTQLTQIESRVRRAEADQRTYLLTGRSADLEGYRAAINELRATMGRLGGLTLESDAQRQALIALTVPLEQQIDRYETAIRLRQEQGLQVAAAFVQTNRGPELSAEIHQRLTAMDMEERRLLQQRETEADAAAARTVVVIGLGTVLALLFVGTATVLINRDIAERRRTEQALRESEAQHRLLAENATDMISRQSPEGIFRYVSPASERITGYLPHELVGTLVFDLYHPDERAGLEFRHAAAAETGAMQMHIYRVRRKDGEYTWVESNVRGVVHPERGEVTELHASWRDVSDRQRAEEEVRESERRLFQFLEALPVGVFVIDSRGRPYYANKAAQQILGGGISPDDARAVGQLAEVFPVYLSGTAEPYPMARRPLDRALSGESALVDDMEIHRPDRVVPLEVRAVPILDRRGQVAYAVGVFSDITERRAVERMKDEFVSTVSHELRTPLTSIRGALGLLTGGMLGPLPEQGQRMLDIAVTNTDRLIRLINDILDIERMESGKIVMRKQVCDIGALMSQAADEMRAMADGAAVTLTVAPAAARVWADPDRLLQTIANLLSNAIKFSNSGGTVRMTGALDGDNVLVQVTDEGRGIPPDKLESIFERFQQIDASDSRQKGGTGLGLAISRSIVLQHGGRMWAESTPGKGSVFSFTLPVFTGEPADTPPSRESP